MVAEENEKDYNEDVAIKYILSNLPSGEEHNKYSEDDILLVIDTIFDFYESRGFFEIDSADEEDDFDEKELIDFVRNALKKDKDNKVSLDDVANIVHLELEYEDSLN